jgi:hypothetical protein
MRAARAMFDCSLRSRNVRLLAPLAQCSIARSAREDSELPLPIAPTCRVRVAKININHPATRCQ